MPKSVVIAFPSGFVFFPIIPFGFEPFSNDNWANTSWLWQAAKNQKQGSNLEAKQKNGSDLFGKKIEILKRR